MSNKRRTTSFNELDMYRGGYSPFEAAGQRALSREPAAFDYTELDKRYPVQGVRPIVPSYIQKQIDEEEVILKSQELEMRKREAQLNIYDSQLNQERAMYEQIPMARQALAELNPADDDFLNQLIAQQANNPIAYENPDFQQTVVSPLIRRHEMLQQNKLIMQRGAKPQEEDIVTENDLIAAGGVLSNVTTQNKAKKGDIGASAQIEGANEIVRRWRQQQAAQSQTVIPSGSPIPSASPVPSVTPQTQSRGVKALDEFYIGR